MDLDDIHDVRQPFGKGHGASNPAMLIIGAEDEEFENDIDPTVDDNCSHFQCIDLLKDRPTYLIIFLHHVILQFDAASVLCYLHGEMFKGVNAKDARRMFVDYFHTFLDRGAVLRVSVPQEISFELDRSRPDMICDEGLRKIVKDMQKAMTLEIHNQLEDFRNKRMMGMTIGERELAELDSERIMDRATLDLKEKIFAEQLLPKVEEATSNTDDDKSTSVYNAVVTYMKYLGIKTKEPRPLEKKRHFLMRRKGPTPKKDSEPVKPDEKRRKGIGSILDLRRQTRNDPSSIKAAIDRKNSNQAAKSQLETVSGRQKAGGTLPEGSEVTGAGGSSHVLAREDSECDTVHPSTSLRPGNENQPFPDCGETNLRLGSSSEQVSGGEHGQDEGGETERRKIRLPGKLGRSESLRTYGERRRSHKGSAKGKQPRSRSDVDIQAAAKATDLQSRNVEPGGGGGPDSQQSFLPPQSEDNLPRVSELEADPPSWRQLISSEILLRLKKSEVRRQEVINELFITEHAHVRMLKVLYEIFHLRMLSDNILTDTELQSIFPSLDELIEVHTSFYENLKQIRQENGYLVTEIGSTLLARFHGPEGDWFKKLASRFCSLQSFALELIKSKHRKDPRFSQFIQDAESNPQCRRLQLKDIIPIEMQRLTKYPLLLENIAKYTDQSKEKQKVQQAADCCRSILKDVNQEVRDTENLRRLHDYQRRLDISNLKQSTDPVVADFKNIDLTQRRMVHEGPLVWKVTKEKAIDVHVLLLDDILLLMQKVDDKMVLKCHSKNSTLSEGKQMLCPIIKLGSVLARDVATDRKAFFVLFQTDTGGQIYELVAQTVSERRNWCDKIQSTQDALKLLRLSMAPRNSLVPPSASVPLSPTMSYREPMLNAENGVSTRERINSELTAKESDGLSQDSGTGELCVDERPGAETPTQSAGQVLAELLKANDVDLAKLAYGPAEWFADQALEDVHTMKRALNRSKRASKESDVGAPANLALQDLLRRQSSSLSVQPQGDAGQDSGPRWSEADPNGNESREEGGGTEAEREQEPAPAEGERATGPAGSEGDNANESERGETESADESPEGEMEEQEGWVKGTGDDLYPKQQLPESPGGPISSGVEADSNSTPIVLSLDQAEEMERKMNSLLVKIQHLKAMEEEYHRLRQALLNLTMVPRHSLGNYRRVSGERW